LNYLVDTPYIQYSVNNSKKKILLIRKTTFNGISKKSYGVAKKISFFSVENPVKSLKIFDPKKRFVEKIILY
jgi:hypothetical protein